MTEYFLKDRITRGNGTGEQTSTLNNWETWPYHSKQYVRQVLGEMDAYDPRYSGGARASQWQSQQQCRYRHRCGKQRHRTKYFLYQAEARSSSSRQRYIQQQVAAATHTNINRISMARSEAQRLLPIYCELYIIFCSSLSTSPHRALRSKHARHPVSLDAW